MKIQAVKFYKNGFMTEPFAFGGEDIMEAFDAGKKYRSCLQNYVIDTGNEVIWWIPDCLQVHPNRYPKRTL